MTSEVPNSLLKVGYPVAVFMAVLFGWNATARFSIENSTPASEQSYAMSYPKPERIGDGTTAGISTPAPASCDVKNTPTARPALAPEGCKIPLASQ